MKYLVLLIIIYPSYSRHITFTEWKERIIKKFEKKGLNRSFLTRNLANVEYNDSIVRLDRTQGPKKTQSFEDVISRFLQGSHKRKFKKVISGKKNLKKFKEILEKIEKKYKVDKEVIVALWATETNFGKYKGTFPLLESLSTLAYDQKRSEFFEKELFLALKIMKDFEFNSKDFTGSWAGAMGHCQFMPSSFITYAVDGDKDGKKDIWNNMEDVFHSMANYLKKAGWKYKKGWGALYPNRRFKKKNFVKYSNRRGKKVNLDLNASPNIYRGENYRTLLRWNKSDIFVIKVGILTDLLKS